MNLAFFKPNKLNYSETFVDAHIRLLPDPKFVLYGGFFKPRDRRFDKRSTSELFADLLTTCAPRRWPASDRKSACGVVGIVL